MSNVVRKALLIIATCIAAASAATAKHIVLSSGEFGYSVLCDNQNINACYEKAGEVCHRGYTVLEQNKESGFISEGSASLTSLGGRASAVSATTTEKGMIIQCKEPELTEQENRRREIEAAEQERMRKSQEERQFEAGARGARWFFGVVLLVVVAGALLLASNR